MIISQIWQLLTAFLPAWFAVALLSVLTILVILLVIKLIAFVMDAIPFV